MKKLHIIKRITPVLAASVAVSALYTGGVLANAEEHTVYIEDIFDTVEIGAGYYEEPVYVKTNLVAPDKFVAEPYSDGNNNTIDADRTLSRTELDLNTYSDGLNYDISVGVDEQLTLSPGYYYGNINIKNGVKDNGDPSAVLDGNNQYVDLPAGFYNTGRVGINSTAWIGLVSAINTNFGTSYTGDESFASIAEGITGEKFSYNSTGTAIYHRKGEGTNTRIGASAEETSLSGVELAGETIDLGVDETIVIPAGYYGEAITVQNGVLHNENVNTNVSANNNETNGASEVTYGPGYYDSITVKDNTSKGTIKKTSLTGVTRQYNSLNKKWE